VEVVGEGNFSAFGLLERLRQAGGYTTLFLMELGGGKTFVGATPEMLLQFRYRTDRLYLQSDALAGSSALGDTLLASGKDLAEHQIVVDSIVTAYRRVGASVGQIPPPRLLPLNHIQHLYTPIWGEWQTKAWQDVFQLLDLLHPTAAVGGKPRENALAFIRQFESWNREGYAAPIGWFNTAGEGEFAVAIRSGYVEGNRVRMFAGAGIVEDSQIDREWEETNLKLQGMLKALGL
jgi:menaquinone-specific isochorismate synthase